MTWSEIADWTANLRPGTVRDLFEYLPDLMYFAKDRQLRLMAGNRAFVHHCGLRNEEELLGKKDHDIFPLQLAEKFAQDDRWILTHGKAIKDMVELFPNELGTPEWYSTDKIPLFDREGRIAGLCGLVRPFRIARDSPVGKVTEIFNRDYAGKVSIAGIAADLGLSVRQLERKFQKTFGTTPSRYLMRLRILKACGLLRAGSQSITVIALEVGFYDHSAFSRKFSQLIGESPGAYRRRFAKT